MPITRTIAAPLTLVAAASLLLTGCALSTPADNGVATPGSTSSTLIQLDRPEISAHAEDEAISYPITIEHALGETTIVEEPQRIVALGAVERDAVIALGAADRLVGAGVPFYDDSVNPWIDDLVSAEDFVAIPWDQNAQYNIEQILSLDPDLILAPTSFTISTDYATLSAVVPTIAFLENPITDRWQDVTQLTGDALGQPARAAALVDEAESALSQLAEAYPGLQGKTVSFTVAQGGDAYGVLSDVNDTMIKNLSDLGLSVPAAVEALPENPLNPGVSDISIEEIGAIDADLILIAHMAPDAETATESSPLFDALDGVKDGGYQSWNLLAAPALRTPTALSLYWGLNTISGTLSTVADK